MTGPSPLEIHLRPARLEDARWMAAHDGEIFGLDSWSEDAYRAELTAPDRTYVVAHIGPAIAGQEAAGPAIAGWGGLWTGEPAQIMTIATLAPYRRRGVARRIMGELIASARRAGARELWLEVRADDDGAQALYRSLGFRGQGIRRRYYRDGDALTMCVDFDSAAAPRATMDKDND